jgi:hypothetical protein
MLKEGTTTAIKENEVETNEAIMPNDGEVVVKGVRFYCSHFEEGRFICTSIDPGKKVQLNPPKNSYFYSEMIKQLTNGFQG